MKKTKYSVKTFSSEPIFDIDIPYEKIYGLLDLIWIIPLAILALAFGIFIALFYYLFPYQLILLIILSPVYLLIILIPSN